MEVLKTRTELEARGEEFGNEGLERIAELNARVDFSVDQFELRRAAQGAGNPWDPESLLTGEEVAAGLDYDCPRDWSGVTLEVRKQAEAGFVPTEVVAKIAPRRRK